MLKTNLLLVGLGGALGSILRYLTSLWVVSKTTFFSSLLGTFTVNIVGCFIIGIVYGLSEHYDWLSPQWRLFLATGLCGGYTTFSAFAYENANLWQQGNYLTSFAYIFLSVFVCLAATFAGIVATKLI
jgi:CrcB protein